MRTKWWSGALAAVTAGAVSELTLAEVKRLRLKVGLGGSQAPLTDERVPTLAEAMAVVKGRAMVNLDKAWDIRDDVYDVLVETTRSITGDRVWINTLWYGQAAGYTDESSLRDRRRGGARWWIGTTAT